MKVRRNLGYPPYYYLCYVKISGKDMKLLGNEANKIKRSLERNLKNTKILGPTPLPIFKINNIYRYGIILKYKKEDKLKDILEKIIKHYQSNTKIRIDIDFNPSHFS